MDFSVRQTTAALRTSAATDNSAPTISATCSDRSVICTVNGGYLTIKRLAAGVDRDGKPSHLTLQLDGVTVRLALRDGLAPWDVEALLRRRLATQGFTVRQHDLQYGPPPEPGFLDWRNVGEVTLAIARKP